MARDHAHQMAGHAAIADAATRVHASATASRRAALGAATALGTALLAVSLVAPAGAQERTGRQADDRIQLAQSGPTRTFAIEPQPLTDALDRFSERTGISFAYKTRDLADVETSGVSGELTPANALDRLLAGTGVAFEFTGDKTVTLSQAAGADEGGGAQRLGPITVEATGESAYGPVDGYKAERSATATRTDTPIMDVPASVQVVPRQVIEDQEAQDLPEVVRNVSSVFVDNSFGGIGRDFNIRGFNQDFKLRNGLREESSAVQRSQSLANVERVEVLKGPSSIISGRLAPGGVVNVVTKRPTSEPLYELELQGGTTSEGGASAQPSLDFSGPITGDGSIKYRLNARYTQRDSFREPFEQDVERFFVAPVVSFDLGPDTDLIIEGEYTHDERPFDRGVVFFDGTFSDRSRNLQSSSVVSETDSAIGSYTLDHRFTDNLKLRHRSQVIYQEGFKLENVPFAPATDFPGSFPNAERGDFARYIAANDRTFTTYSTQTELHAGLEGPLADHDFLFAFDYAWDEDNNVFQSTDSAFAFPNYRGVPNTINIFDPVDVVPAPERGDIDYVASDTTTLTEEFGLLLQDQITLSEQWELLLGGRVSWVDQETVNRIAGTSDSQRDNAVFSPRAGVVYKPVENVSLYGSYSESFEPNTAQDQDGNFLEPTEGQQFEVGVKTEFLDGRLRTTLAGFQITKTNIPRSVNRLGQSFSVPTGEQRSRGLELDVTGQITEGWTVIGSYAFLDTEITKDETNKGNELAGVPSHSASLWSNYQIQTGTLKGLQFGAGVFYRGKRQANNANSFELPSYARVDARIGYQRDNWEVNLALKNLFDTEDNYEAVDFGPLVQPGIPFTATASISVKF